MTVIPASEETNMLGTKYVGRHRVLEEKTAITHQVVKSRWARRTLVPFSVFTAVIFGFSSTAFASSIQVRSGDTFSGLVARQCGTSNWQGVSFPGRDKNMIYAGETIDITCAGSAPKTSTAPAPAVAPQSSSGWYSPLAAYGNGSCNFWEWRQTKSGGYNHRGEDFAFGAWTPIRAIASGQATANWGSGTGNQVVIRHSNGAATVYMHMVQRGVSGWVHGGQVIGYVGSTGDSSGPHLHFEVHPWGYGNGVISPTKWMADRGVRIGC